MYLTPWHAKTAQLLTGYDPSENPTALTWLEQLIVTSALFIIALFFAILSYFLVKKIILNLFSKIAKLTKNNWDDALAKSSTFKWLAMLAPVAIIWHSTPLIYEALGMEQVKQIGAVISVISEILLVIMILLAINAVLNVIETIYQRFEVSRELPIKSFFQVIKIILTMVGLIFIISSIIGKSPLLLFSGLGAMTAILMLIFKDSILGLVAGIQLSANRMVARGDWIEMPKFGADGEVLEVALTTVKVRNWDKTITTIPTYSLISDSFKNWRGMSNSGVRRIKRSICLDMASIKFIDQPLLERMKKVSIIQSYLSEKEKDIEAWNQERNIVADDLINARALTNVGTFRAYIAEYLKNHPSITNKETLLVRQLQPNHHGLPIEIYVFSSDSRWIQYEGIQADIFDHLLAVLVEFDLRVYQSPTGADFAQLAS